MNNRTLFLSRGAWKSKIEAPANSVSGESLPPGLYVCPHVEEGAGELLGGLFYEGTGPICEASGLMS